MEFDYTYLVPAVRRFAASTPYASEFVEEAKARCC